MNKNTSILIWAIVVSSGWFFLAPLIPVACEGFGYIGVGIGIFFIHLIVIPFIFGILGATFSAEQKIKRFFVSFGISFLVALAIGLPFYITEKIRNEKEAAKQDQGMRDSYYANPERYKQRPF